MTSELERKKSDRLGQLPHAVVDDRRLRAGSLALLAYRTLYIGAFRLHHRDVRGKFARGLGEDAFHRELKALKTVGYINRWQPRRGDGDYARAVENVNLTVAPQGREGYQQVPQTIFNGSLSANEVAALVFLRSHAPNYPVYVRYLAERFLAGDKKWRVGFSLNSQRRAMSKRYNNVTRRANSPVLSVRLTEPKRTFHRCTKNRGRQYQRRESRVHT